MKKYLPKSLLEYLPLILITTIIILLTFGIFLFLDRPFIVNSDQQLTYNLFYQEWIRLIKDFIKTGQFPFYSWYKFLGSDFYSSASIYVTGDIFIPLLLMFRNVSDGLMFEVILLIYISSFTFYYFLKIFGLNNRWNLTLFSIIYAFSGIAVLYFGNYMFHRFYAFLPLLFAGVEIFLNSRKALLFIASVSLLFITSMYFTYPTSLFLVPYFIFSYLRREHKARIKEFIKLSLTLIALYLLGLLITSVFSLPALITLLNNARVGAPYDPSLTWDLKVSIGFLISHLVAPYALFTDIPYMFASGFNGHSTWYSVYSTTLPTILVIYYFIFIQDKFKKYYIFLYTSIFTIIFFKPINSFFHGFSEPTFRFVFLYVFVILVIAANVLENYTHLKLLKSYSFYLFFVFIGFIILFKLNILDYSIYRNHINFICLSLVIGFFVNLLIHFDMLKYSFFLILLELTVISTFVIYNLNVPYYSFKPSITKEYLDYYTKIDEDIFYRIYINPKHLYPTNNLNLNQSLNYMYQSTTTYDSNYEFELKDFLNLNNFDWHIIHLDNPEVLSILGVKYYIVYDDSELPLEKELSYVYNLDFLKVYKDKNFKSIGFTYNSFKVIEELRPEDQIDWMNQLLIYKKDIPIVKSISNFGKRDYFTVQSRSNNRFEGSINVNEESILFLSIPYNEGWRLYINGTKGNYFKVQGGFIGIKLYHGENHISMNFIPKGFISGLIISVFSLLVLVIYCLYTTHKTKYRNNHRSIMGI